MEEGARGNSIARIGYIDGLRGLAILMVLFLHVNIWAGTNRWEFLYGQRGVDLFFVVSGFIMMWPIANGRALQVGRFWLRRYLRLAPPFWIIMVAGLAVAALDWHYAVKGWSNQIIQNIFPWTWHETFYFLSHLVLLHGYSQPNLWWLDAAFWSLWTEWQFYLIFPLLVWAARKWSLWGVVAVAALGAIAADIYRIAHISHVNLAILINASILARGVTFSLGMLVAAMICGKVRRPSNTVIAFVAGIALTLAVLFESQKFSQWFQVGINVEWGIVFASLVYFANSGWLRDVLSGKFIRKVGESSYSTYLVHGTWFMFLTIPLSHLFPPSWLRVAIFALVGAPGALAIGYVYWQRVELPLHKMAQRIAGADSMSSLKRRLRQAFEFMAATGY